jgi:hypothetical protein
MPHFVILVLWLFGLMACGVMALFRPLRRVAVHFALMGTFAVILSSVLSLALGVGFLALFQGGSFADLAFLLGFAAGFGLGGLIGVVLGHWLAEKIAPLGLWKRVRAFLARALPA